MKTDDLTWLSPENDPPPARPRYSPLGQIQEARLMEMYSSTLGGDPDYLAKTARDLKLMRSLDRRGLVFTPCCKRYRLTSAGLAYCRSLCDVELPF